MTADQMEKEIKECCVSLILNSNNEDWKNINGEKIFIKDNIKIFLLSWGFISIIYSDSSLSDERNRIFLDHTWGIDSLWSKSKRSERRNLIKKHNEIESYINNKNKYDKMRETYKLLPIKELRKKKLQSINESERE